MAWRKVAGWVQSQRLQPRLFRTSRITSHRDELGAGRQLAIVPTSGRTEEDDAHDESQALLRGDYYLEVERPARLAHRLGATGRKVLHRGITRRPPMEIGAHEPRLGQWSQVHADGKWLARDSEARSQSARCSARSSPHQISAAAAANRISPA